MIYKLVTRVIQYFCFPERSMNTYTVSQLTSKKKNIPKYIGVKI